MSINDKSGNTNSDTKLPDDESSRKEALREYELRGGNLSNVFDSEDFKKLRIAEEIAGKVMSILKGGDKASSVGGIEKGDKLPSEARDGGVCGADKYNYNFLSMTGEENGGRKTKQEGLENRINVNDNGSKDKCSVEQNNGGVSNCHKSKGGFGRGLGRFVGGLVASALLASGVYCGMRGCSPRIPPSDYDKESVVAQREDEERIRYEKELARLNEHESLLREIDKDLSKLKDGLNTKPGEQKSENYQPEIPQPTSQPISQPTPQPISQPEIPQSTPQPISQPEIPQPTSQPVSYTHLTLPTSD
ncbi:MAG: PT domain-containing protein, partial [Candidatus Pacearchaeota archaeon]|nr:PT domain-containing protein [Candidatus Pacearchaeota archaeon]